MTILLLFIGLLLIVVGALILLVAAFRVSIWWGLASLLIPFVQLIFVFRYWSEAKSAIVAQTMGLLMILAAVLMGGNKFTDQYQQQLNGYMQKATQGQSQPAAALSQETVTPSGVDIKQEAAVAPETVGQKKIYKCVDAHGKVAYTEQPCVNGKEKKIITIQSNIDSSPSDKVGDVIDKVKEVVLPASNASGFHCDGRTHCSQMTSCEEAKYFLANCPNVEMDGNIDGVPCEKQWCH